ncbi:MAG: hypothetical protein QNI96_00080 [Woeseiaceae bacterium]|nr:hypothetical protein [Woeseiaceae bacterium]
MLSSFKADHHFVPRSLIGVVTACALWLSSTALADSPAPPYTYKIESEDGRYVFVMLTGLSAEEELWRLSEGFGAEISAIKSQYPQSGLYSADDPSNPLWTVDWYAHSVLPFSDGIHLVREGPWAVSGRSEGVSFFANGELLKSYAVSDLVLAPWAMPHSISHFTWRKETSIDDESLSYDVLTIHRESIRFDARTGEITRSFSPPLLLIIVLPGSLVWVVLVLRSRARTSDSE